MRLLADAPPQHVTFLNGLAFVTSGDDGTLRVHDASGRLLRTSRIPTGSYNVQHAFGGFVLMPSLDRGTLCVADGARPRAPHRAGRPLVARRLLRDDTLGSRA